MLPVCDRNTIISDTLCDSILRLVYDEVICASFVTSDSHDYMTYHQHLGAIKGLLRAIGCVCCCRIVFALSSSNEDSVELDTLMIDDDLLVYDGKLAPFLKPFIEVKGLDSSVFSFYDTSVLDNIDTSDPDFYDNPLDHLYPFDDDLD